MQAILNQILDVLSKGESQAIVIAMIFEFGFRFAKTEKPLSIAHLIASTFNSLGSIFSKVGSLLDKVLPQKLK